MNEAEWADLAVRLVGELAWPGVAVAAVVALRRELRALVGRVRKARLGPAEFEMEAARDAVVAAELSDRADPSSAEAAGGVIVHGRAGGLTTSSGGRSAAIPEIDRFSAQDLLRFAYARSVVTLAERILPAEVPRPEIGFGSLSTVMHLVPPVPDVMLRVAALADDIVSRMAADPEYLTFGRATSLQRLLDEVEVFGRTRGLGTG